MRNKSAIIIGAAVFVIVMMVVIILTVSKGRDDGETDLGTKEINIREVGDKITADSAFGEMATMEVTPEILKDYFGVDPDNVVDVTGKIPSMNVHASMYVIVQAKEGKASEVKAALEFFADGYELSWETYLPEQYEIVKKRELDITGDYVYLIIAENADKLKDYVK